MALTGRVIATSIYRLGANDLKNQFGTPATQGVPMNLPAAQCLIYAAPAGTTANGATMATVIELLPEGLNQTSRKYYTTETAAALQSAGT